MELFTELGCICRHYYFTRHDNFKTRLDKHWHNQDIIYDFVVGPAPFPGASNHVVIYIYILHAYVRPAPSGAPAATLLSLPTSQSVSRRSAVNSDSRRRVRSRARRWSIVALVNK